jgi:Alr-MurF fusion protein
MKQPFLIRIKDWAKTFGSLAFHSPHETMEVQYLSTDSRTITFGAETLFFALKTPKRDGHTYLERAYAQGVRLFVISDKKEFKKWPDATMFLVPDTLAALHKLAKEVRARFEQPVIGITGSNGKTIVKEWLFQCLSQHHRVVRSPRSYNSKIGVPFSVWLLRHAADFAILEAGISERGEMNALADMIAPEIGLLTHLGSAHDAGFRNQTEKLAEKMQLFAASKTLIAGQDDPLVQQATQVWLRAQPERTLVTWSATDPTASVFLLERKVVFDRLRQISGTELLLSIRSLTQTAENGCVFLPFQDEASFENAMLTITALIHLGTAVTDLPGLISALEPIEMRLEMKAASNGCTLLNDSYNSDLQSLRIAMDAARNMNRNQAMALVISDFYQTGISDKQLYTEVTQLVVNKDFKRIVAVGEASKMLKKLLPTHVVQHYFDTTDALLSAIATNELRFKDELILLKGARVFAFERISHRLQQKNHHALLEVNMAAMTHNLNVYRRALKPDVKLMVMVKAAGYGSGEAETARLLEHHGADYLGVAFADEGISLRRNGISLPILVLNPAPDEFDAMFRFQLEPEVYSLESLQAAIDYAGTEKTLRVHIKLDTGMHRLGFEPEDMDALCKLLVQYSNLEILSVFSHLSASDKPQFDAFTHQQAAQFELHYEQICAAIGKRPMRHIVNTGGIPRFPEYQFEMVRLGIGLYGAEGEGLSEPLQVVHTLKARISQIRTVPVGDTIGYNRNGPVNQAARIATINIGYADGLLRAAGNGRYQMRIGPYLAPTIGNICMDMCMLDVSHIPEASVGDEVIVFGENPSVEDLAAALKTISYEVFTGISSRVKRVYWTEG